MNEETRKEVKKLLDSLPGTVGIVFFTEKKDCAFCERQHDIVKTIAGMSERITLKVYDLKKNKTEAKRYRVERAPATLITGTKDYGIRFFGLTAGHEFSSFIQAVAMVARGASGLHPDLEALIRELSIPVHLEVLTTLTCPYCPQAVHAAHQIAFINDRVTADMIGSAEFPDLATAYDVTSTPKTMINGTHSFVGAMPAQAVYMEILKALDPKRYDELQAAIREAQGERRVRQAEPGSLYDVIIVGGGPAAMSAAVYAARKQLNCLLVSRDLGGQIAYTASIDNYLGLPGVSGREMKDQFLFHMERYAIAESIGSLVVRIERTDEGFAVRTNDGTTFNGRAVIYCTGKEYNRLGVSGEERFLGHGIAFCATCDAPLYRNKRVAVIGGANSALTAVRDLTGYARTVHLIHRRDRLTADAVLVNEVEKAENVEFHMNSSVTEFLGEEKLTGIRIRTADKKGTRDLPVDGVFLEIGLSPNTGAVKDLLELNPKGEIPVSDDNATTVPGFFAAGDATDVRDKQIAVAVGHGATAALSTYAYLVEKKLIEPVVSADDWR